MSLGLLGLAFALSPLACTTPPAPVEPISETPVEVEPIPLPAPLEAPRLLEGPTSWVLGEPAHLAWTAIADAESYRIQAARDGEFQEILLERSLAGAAAPDGAGATLRGRLDPPLDTVGLLHLRLRAETPKGPGSPWVTTTRKLIPGKPILTEPAPVGTPIREARPTIRWEPVAGATGYSVIVQTAGGEGAPVESIVTGESSGDSYRLGQPLPLPGTYRVQVRSQVHGGIEGEWTERIFEFDPERPSLLAPYPDDRLIRTRPRVKWTYPSEAVSSERFEVELAQIDARGDARGIATNPIRLAVTGPFFQPPPELELERDRRYQVRVRATGSEFWSEAVRFEILKDREERHPLRSLAASPDHEEVRFALSPDGKHLALASLDGGADVGSAPWRLELFRRRTGALSFERLPAPGFSHEARRILTARELDLAWDSPREGPPTLFVGTADSPPRPGAPGRNGIYRHVLWSGRLDPVLRNSGEVPVRALALAGTPGAGVIFFERLDSLTIAPVEPAATGLEARLGHGADASASLIFSVRTDGSAPRPHRPGREPALSPGGQRLACLTTGLASPSIDLLDLAGGASTRLELGGSAGDEIRGLSWSPQGRHLAFARKPSSEDGAGFDLVLLEIETGRQEVLTRSYWNDGSPAFLPSDRLDRDFDGILFASDRSGASWDLYVLEVAR